nr:hypothetical protein Iba_chr12dCG20680 [Ipomoea batatas]
MAANSSGDALAIFSPISAISSGRVCFNCSAAFLRSSGLKFFMLSEAILINSGLDIICRIDDQVQMVNQSSRKLHLVALREHGTIFNVGRNGEPAAESDPTQRVTYDSSALERF